jgi:hypothetical protein
MNRRGGNGFTIRVAGIMGGLGAINIGLWYLKMQTLVEGGQLGLALKLTGDMFVDTAIASTIETIALAFLGLILYVVGNVGVLNRGQ